ncbi:MAG: SDR family oxidoreductase [Planctomycetota bacterium]|nr:SDR family oxidoreductase [Planctomycetota bacterium]
MLSRELEGKACLITGASTGIGRATAIALAEAGAFVGVHYRGSEAEAEETLRLAFVRGARGCLLKGDLRREEDARDVAALFVREAGGMDVLVNNAGSLVRRCKVEQMPLELFREIMDTNFTSAFLMARESIPHLRARKGTIINVHSIAARTGGANGAAIYASAKGALATFTIGLAKELAPDGIRVNAVAPGVIMTPFHERFSTPEALENFRRNTPLGRLGRPEDVAGVIRFLAGPDAVFLVGETIDVNGGLFMR